MGRSRMRERKRYFAIVDKRSKSGHALDYYPEERAAYLREERKRIIGDYATSEEALDAVHQKLLEMCNARAS